MTCERYWREGVVLVERGLDDPHRVTCADCTTAHAARQELIEALPLIGAGQLGNPRWQAQVWRRIDNARAPVPGRWRWRLAGALAVACVLALWLGRGGTRAGDRPAFDVLQGGVAMRSSSVVAGAGLRVQVNATSEVWLYRDDRLVLRCRARQGSDVCARDAGGMTVETVLTTVGTYRVFAVEAPAAPPRGELDEDRGALVSAGVKYVEKLLLVR